MFLMAGLLPLAVSQAQAQSSATNALLGEPVKTLPSTSAHSQSDAKSSDLTAPLDLTTSDLLGSQDSVTLPQAHSGSGSSAGWLVGGTLGLAAGVLGLASGGGSAGASAMLRTPALPDAPTVFTSVETAGNINTGSGIVTTLPASDTAPLPTVSAPVSTGSDPISAPSTGDIGPTPFSVPGSGSFSSNGFSGGGFTPAADTPEPGSLAMFGGLCLTFTVGVLRRRKR